jgi:organic hydroperoxide reductase OsmC/OhrA
MDPHTYTTGLRWVSEHRGELSAPGLPDIAVATPPPFPGGQPGLWSPEHLFVAAAEACLMTTFLSIAKNSKLDFREYSSRAEGLLEKTPDGYRIAEILIRPRLVLADAGAADRARRILEKAEEHCLISRSMKTVVKLDIEIVAV